ncbi:hypothetical protein QBC45DRAFT_302067, partial [Copromyces sp. CBS 386.78]
WPGVNQRHKIEVYQRQPPSPRPIREYPTRLRRTRCPVCSAIGIRVETEVEVKNMHGHEIDMDSQNPQLVSDVRHLRAGCGCDVFNVSIKNMYTTQKAQNHHNFKG